MSQNVPWLAINLASKFKMPKNEGERKKGVIKLTERKKKNRLICKSPYYGITHRFGEKQIDSFEYLI